MIYAAALDALGKEGVWRDAKVAEYDYREFGWIMDPGGNRIEFAGAAA